MKKIIKNKIFVFIILCIISCGIGVYAVSKYTSEEFTYTKEDGTSVTLNDALNELYNSKTECEKDSFCSKVKLGDYIKMTPTSTSYTVDSTKTGWKESSNYSSDDVINPSELNIWRVIKKNDNGTIEMVSANVSSTKVTFYGQTGYLNLVGALNEIASQYENSKYTIGSKIVGYNGQTEYITDTSIFTNPATLTSSTIDNSNESLGGGDVMYEDYYRLIDKILGTKGAANPSGTETSYWLGSRKYRYNISSIYNFAYYSWNGYLTGGSGGNEEIIDNPLYYYNTIISARGWTSNALSYAIRPILTLKSGLTATGSGTSEDPWVLQ